MSGDGTDDPEETAGSDGGPDGSDDDSNDSAAPGDTGEPAGPHALGTIILGESHSADGGIATPIISAVFIPDAELGATQCTQDIAGCTVAVSPDCGDAGCDAGEYCAFDDGCQSTCLDSCDAACGPGEVCYFPSPGNTACRAIESFDAGPLTFGGTTTALTLFPPYTFNGEASGAPYAPGAMLSVEAAGAAAAGYESFEQEFTAIDLLQTDLEQIGVSEAYSDGPLPVSWTPGSATITVTAAVAGASGRSAVITCEAEDSTGAFSFPRVAINAAIDDEALTGLTLTVTRRRTDLHTGLSTTGQLSDVAVQEDGWLELVTMSSESQVIESCGPNDAICDNSCVDVSDDRDNCGSCGNTCAVGDACVNGTCSGLDACLACGAAGPAACAQAQDTCDANPECVALLECWPTCNDQACIATCGDMHEAGWWDDLSNLADCWCGGPCQAECDVFFDC